MDDVAEAVMALHTPVHSDRYSRSGFITHGVPGLHPETGEGKCSHDGQTYPCETVQVVNAACSQWLSTSGEEGSR